MYYTNVGILLFTTHVHPLFYMIQNIEYTFGSTLNCPNKETKSNALELFHIKVMWLVSWLLLFIYYGFLLHNN